MEVPMTEGHDAAEAQSGNAMKELGSFSSAKFMQRKGQSRC